MGLSSLMKNEVFPHYNPFDIFLRLCIIHFGF
jgi:hypothetical protein